MRVLLVEDDAALSVPLLRIFSREGFEAELVKDWESLKLWTSERIVSLDLIVMDRMIGNRDSLEWLGQIISNGPTVPTLMISARAEVQDRVFGLHVGVDDYLCKPFDSAELLARMRSLVRRSKPVVLPIHLNSAGGSSLSEVQVQNGILQLDETEQLAKWGERVVPLTKIEFRLLSYFAAREGQPLSREKILQSVWGYRFQSTRTLDLHVAQIRQKLGKSCIETLHGRGYRFQSQFLKGAELTISLQIPNSKQTT